MRHNEPDQTVLDLLATGDAISFGGTDFAEKSWADIWCTVAYMGKPVDLVAYRYAIADAPDEMVVVSGKTDDQGRTWYAVFHSDLTNRSLSLSLTAAVEQALRIATNAPPAGGWDQFGSTAA